MQNFKINWDTLSRLFIGALFVSAGFGKLTGFAGTTAYINSVLNTGSMSFIITSVVIFIEIVVASVYVYGKYKKDTAGYWGNKKPAQCGFMVHVGSVALILSI